MTRHDAETTLLHLAWGPERVRGPVDRALRPSPADWAMIELPTPMWWAYPLVRVARLGLERVGARSRDHADLEPFLVTPHSLLQPVLDVAGVGDDDLVLDFGCGDGRFLVAAAERGCRVIGVERSAELAGLARRTVTERGLDERVRVVHGDALAVDLAAVTVVVLFVPLVVARRVIPELVSRLAPGARIVLHEQSALPPDLPRPDRSVPIVANDAVTVAHRWDLDERARGPEHAGSRTRR